MTNYLRPRTKVNVGSVEDDTFKVYFLHGHWSESAIINLLKRHKRRGKARYNHGYYYTHKTQYMFDDAKTKQLNVE